MRRRRIISAIFSAGFIVVVICLLGRKRDGPFATFVCAPAPDGVNVTIFQNDAGLLRPEPVCYLAFTGDSANMETVVRRGQFQTCSDKGGFPVPSGPQGWRTADQVGTNASFYRRSHEPKTINFLPPIGNNRRWHEYLWIDETGTNAYFLLWGI